MDTSKSVDFSYFEILVRWSEFPPANSLEVSDIYFALDFAGPDHAWASTDPARKEGDASTFHRLTLERPKVSTIGPCGYPLQETDLFQDRYPAWYLMNRDGRVADIFALENFVGRYQYSPEGLSPIPVWKHHFSKSVGKAEVVCGPDLRYTAGQKTFLADGKFDIDEHHLEVRRLQNGGHLLKSGPTFGTLSPLGSGACGSCATADLTIYHLDPTSGITVAFRGDLLIDPPSTTDGDIRVAPDWQSVTVFRATGDENGKETWSSKRYCLSGTHYMACGENPHVVPPVSRSIQWGNLVN
jgi:hypothetical protein